MHAHSDLALLRDPDHTAKAAQGVTLEVIGQDGLSYAPVDDRTLAEVRSAITGWNGERLDDIDFDWRTVGEYLDRLDRPGHRRQRRVPRSRRARVRMLAVGWDDRAATPEELRPDEAAGRRGPGAGRGRHVLRPDLHARACTPPTPN